MSDSIDSSPTAEQLMTLRNYLVEQCNQLSQEVDRDENGYLIYDYDLDAEMANNLQSLSEDYPRLSGFYPKVKSIAGSYFMYQTGTLGVYFPQSLEANCNKYISTSIKAFIYGHELSHLKGYIYENEANYLAYLACIASDKKEVQYSGYLYVLGYVNYDLYTYFKSLNLNDITYYQYCNGIWPNDQVIADDCEYDPITQEYLESIHPVVSTETVDTISDNLSDSYYSFYHSSMNYNEVTLLLINYYKGILY